MMIIVMVATTINVKDESSELVCTKFSLQCFGTDLVILSIGIFFGFNGERRIWVS